jgi:hypothetical protein
MKTLSLSIIYPTIRNSGLLNSPGIHHLDFILLYVSISALICLPGLISSGFLFFLGFSWIPLVSFLSPHTTWVVTIPPSDSRLLGPQTHRVNQHRPSVLQVSIRHLILIFNLQLTDLPDSGKRIFHIVTSRSLPDALYPTFFTLHPLVVIYAVCRGLSSVSFNTDIGVDNRLT